FESEVEQPALSQVMRQAEEESITSENNSEMRPLDSQTEHNRGENSPELGDTSSEIYDDSFNNEILSQVLPRLNIPYVKCIGRQRRMTVLYAFFNCIIGVFAPFLPTDRMRVIFKEKTLEQLVVQEALPDPKIDNSAVLKAVR
ncbi:hypothetical protein BGZ76_007373, partial [Entomortierella beljakovae]